MVELRMLNDGVNYTAIETFDGRAILVSGKERMEFKNLEELKKTVQDLGLQVNITCLHGPSIRKEHE